MVTPLRQRIHIALKYMEQGRQLLLNSGHTLVIPEGYDEPGFLTTVYKGQEVIEDNVVVQIGSDISWMSLIGHLKKADEDSIAIMAMNTGLTEFKRGKRGKT